MSDGTVCRHCNFPIYQIGDSWRLRYANEIQTQGATLCQGKSYSGGHEPAPAEQPRVPRHIQAYYEEGGMAAVPASPAGPRTKVTIYDPIEYLERLSADLGQRGECDLWFELPFCIESLKTRLELAQPSVKVEEIADEIVNLESQKHLYAASNWREEYPKLVAALLRPYFTTDAPLWISAKERLPEDDSDVFAAIWWNNKDNPEYSGYQIHDCLYYEGGTGSGQKIFADCEGEEFEHTDVQFWIYRKALASTVPLDAPSTPATAPQHTNCDANDCAACDAAGLAGEPTDGPERIADTWWVENKPSLRDVIATNLNYQFRMAIKEERGEDYTTQLIRNSLEDYRGIGGEREIKELRAKLVAKEKELQQTKSICDPTIKQLRSALTAAESRLKTALEHGWAIKAAEAIWNSDFTGGKDEWVATRAEVIKRQFESALSSTNTQSSEPK